MCINDSLIVRYIQRVDFYIKGMSRKKWFLSKNAYQTEFSSSKTEISINARPMQCSKKIVAQSILESWAFDQKISSCPSVYPKYRNLSVI